MQNDEDLPEDLACPITFTLMRDPVRCVEDGRVYDRESLVKFWRFRPLADFYGGPELPSAAMEPSLETRERVQRWLADHPEAVPDGWPGRSPGRQCSQPELDALAREIEALAAARRVAAAAQQAGPNGARAEQEASR